MKTKLLIFFYFFVYFSVASSRSYDKAGNMYSSERAYFVLVLYPTARPEERCFQRNGWAERYFSGAVVMYSTSAKYARSDEYMFPALQ